MLLQQEEGEIGILRRELDPAIFSQFKWRVTTSITDNFKDPLRRKITMGV
jgi:hypothetical protein